jgi:hypothetical protein
VWGAPPTPSHTMMVARYWAARSRSTTIAGDASGGSLGLDTRLPNGPERYASVLRRATSGKEARCLLANAELLVARHLSSFDRNVAANYSRISVMKIFCAICQRPSIFSSDSWSVKKRGGIAHLSFT